MYKRLLLASDGTRESSVALREGALIAQTFGATAHLLVIDRESPSVRVAESMSLQPCPMQGRELLDLGLTRLRRLGVRATGELARGEPAQLITQCVHRLGIDLIVLGHRRQSILDRWWSGPNGAYIVDGVACSLLVARDTITDEEFERHFVPEQAEAVAE